jgi:hypothetical protein
MRTPGKYRSALLVPVLLFPVVIMLVSYRWMEADVQKRRNGYKK